MLRPEGPAVLVALPAGVTSEADPSQGPVNLLPAGTGWVPPSARHLPVQPASGQGRAFQEPLELVQAVPPLGQQRALVAPQPVHRSEAAAYQEAGLLVSRQA